MFLFFPLTIREAAAASLVFNCNTCNTKTPGSSTCLSVDACDGLLCCFRHLWMEQQSHTDTDSSFIHVLKSMLLLVWIFFFPLIFSYASPHSILYISPKNRLKELCPKECVYKLPINTLTHALMHSHARTPTVYIPLFPLCRRSRQYLSDTLPPLSLVEARLAQVSVAKTNEN